MPTLGENEDSAASSKSTGNYDMSACSPMKFSGDLSIHWNDWYNKFEIFMIAANFTQEQDVRKNALLLKCMGKPALNIFNSFGLKINDVKHDDLVNKFKNHFSPKTNVTVERITIFNRKQKPGESLEDFQPRSAT